MWNSSYASSIKTYWTSYRLASLFFDKTTKEATFLLYAFVREADNIVDNWQHSPEESRARLQEMKSATLKTFQWGDQPSQLINDYVTLCHDYKIPWKRTEAFFDAMIADTKKYRYATYKELQTYMYGSAEVIWLMMCRIIWVEEEWLHYAKLLWEAMQYTNFLRDVKEDYLVHWRIYLPEERLLNFDLNHEVIKKFCTGTPINDSWKKFMAAQIVHCKACYSQANRWITYLEPWWRLPVYLASRLYEAILWRIRKNKYDVFTKDAHTTRREKQQTIMISLIQRRCHQRWKRPPK